MRDWRVRPYQSGPCAASSPCVGDRECRDESSIRDVGFTTATPPEESDPCDTIGLINVADGTDAESRVERICLAVHALGGDGHAYRRERASAARAVVAEVYAAPNVTAAAGRLPKYGMMPGLALDITVDDDTGQPYDFSVKAQRDKAEALIDARQPVLLIGSPMCTAFSVI